MRPRTALVVLLSALASAGSIAQTTPVPSAATYRYDTVHSQILFSVEHDGYSRPFGRLHIARGVLVFDAKDFTRSHTELDIDLAGLDMGDAAWNKAVLASSYLDAARGRYAHFASTQVEQTDARHGVLHGTLTLRGVNQPVSLPFTFNREGRTIFGLHDVAGFSAHATLRREAFGMTANANSVGHDVVLWLEIEAVRDRDAAAAPASSTAPGPAHADSK